MGGGGAWGFAPMPRAYPAGGLVTHILVCFVQLPSVSPGDAATSIIKKCLSCIGLPTDHFGADIFSFEGLSLQMTLALSSWHKTDSTPHIDFLSISS